MKSSLLLCALMGLRCNAYLTMVAQAPTRSLVTQTRQVPGLRNGMRYRQLGNSDLLVSDVCLGTMTWGQQNTDDEAMAQMNRAWDHFGINFLDTAEMYPVPTKAETQGSTDRAVAKFLRTRKREDVVLATQVCGRAPQITWVRDSGEGPRVDRANIRESVHKSLERLGTDYIDLLQIHWPDRYVPIFGQAEYQREKERADAVPIEEQLEAFAELVAEGKVRYIGVSNETPMGVTKFCETAMAKALPEIVSIQNSYSLLVRKDFESGLAEACAPYNYNVGLLAYSPLAGGVLSGKYQQANPPANARLNLFKGYMNRYRNSLSEEAVVAYAAAAKEAGVSPTELALAWCYKREAVASTIIGATSLSQLDENVGAFDVELSEDTQTAIDSIYHKYTDPTKMYT